MKQFRSILALLLVSIMLLGILASCGGGNEKETTGSDAPLESESSETQNNGSDSVGETDDDGESSEEIGGGDKEDETDFPIADGDDGELISHTNALANKVYSFYSNADRTDYVIGNSNMQLNYNTSINAPQQVTSLTDKKGNSYIKDTMDVFVRMRDGKTYYSSGSIIGASTNIYRLGYYYYETRIENQVFVDGDTGVISKNIQHRFGNTHNVTVLETGKESIICRIDDISDPYVVFAKVSFSTDKYKYLQFTMKGTGIGGNGQVFVQAGGSKSFNGEQCLSFTPVGDGQYHTYTIPISNIKNYTEDVTGIRLDINGSEGATFEIKDVRALSLGENTPEELFLNRSFLTFSDKMHQIIQIAASKKTENIEAVGMQTKIDADRVAGVVIKDRQGLHYSIEDKIAWNTVQYVGFLIKDTGVFGYMLPYDGKGGSIRVELTDGVYTVEQRGTPEGWTIYPSSDGSGNASDFYLGQRIYTDTNDDFEKFIYEAECEVNPLPAESFVIDPLRSSNGKCEGYDSLRGVYRFTLSGADGFNGAFYNYPNRQFAVEFNVKGDDKNRNIYVMTYASGGSLECAAILDENKMMLPIPIEVAKNFKGDGENTIFMKDDFAYSETYLPLIVKANSSDEFTIINLYQNWGRFPLKQISSVQFFSPYYHISCGVTETNCVVPYNAAGLLLPDFRSMSAPFWPTQPQHNSCGTHNFVHYTDSDGVFNENHVENVVIDSYGPTYADMTTVFISDDDNIRITYNHMEQPHTDENRTFYQLRLEVLGDVSINNFKDDFYFYSVTPNNASGEYQRVGYLNEANESVVVPANMTGVPVDYKLGDNCPYISFFDMDGYDVESNGYSNVAMLIYNSEFIIGGEKRDVDFILRDMTDYLRLTLDLGETTLKAGDTLTINGILLPWGSQEMEGHYDELQDKNVRDVRADSLLNPLTVTPVENCEKVHNSVGIFLPEVKTTNGKSATFTLSGGNNNNAVRIYGFDKLTVPVIEELVNGQWQAYDVSSIGTPDKQGYGYKYDGYNVNYDKDGTYSYSFVAAIDNGKERTFRITAEADFEGWGEESDPIADMPINVYVEPGNMSDIAVSIGTPFGCTYDINLDEGFFRFYGDGQKTEGYVGIYTENPLFPTTGRYFVFKYRVPVTNNADISHFDIFTSTESKGATGKGDTIRASGAAIRDGKWHVIVVDLSTIEQHIPDEDGNYKTKFLRLDMLNCNSAIDSSNYIDIAYYGFNDNIEDVVKMSADMDSIFLCQDGTLKTVDVKSGEIKDYEGSDTPVIPDPPVVPDPPKPTVEMNVLVLPEDLADVRPGGCTLSVSDDGSYMRFTGKGSAEGFIQVYKNTSPKQVTGKYSFMRYRIPEGVEMSSNLQIYASTLNSAPEENGGKDQVLVSGIVKSEGWQIIIVDLSTIGTFVKEGDAYYANYARFDVMNGKYDENSYIDVEYFGIHDSLVEILAKNSDLEKARFVDAYGTESWIATDGSVSEPKEPGTPDENDSINVYYSPEEISKLSIGGADATLSDDKSYIRFTAKGAAEGYVTYKNPTGADVTGQYFVFKYRVPSTVTAAPASVDVFTSTKNAVAAASDRIQIKEFKADGEWHVVIVDLSCSSTFDAAANAKYVRLDIINGKFTNECYVDLAYCGLNDNLEELYALNTDMDTVTFVDANGTENNVDPTPAA